MSLRDIRTMSVRSAYLVSLPAAAPAPAPAPAADTPEAESTELKVVIGSISA